jgi:MT0933-like antitoxin protein
MRTPPGPVTLGGKPQATRRAAMSMRDKLKGLLKGHEDVARQGVDKAGDAFDEKTQGKYSSQVDAAQEKLKEQLRQQDTDNPPQ